MRQSNDRIQKSTRNQVNPGNTVSSSKNIGQLDSRNMEKKYETQKSKSSAKHKSIISSQNNLDMNRSDQSDLNLQS